MENVFFSLLVVLLCLLLRISVAYDKEMTIHIEAGGNSCFFQNVKLGEIIDLEYQVIDGGHGDLDINFLLVEPRGRVIFSDVKKSDNVHRHEARIDGDYHFCFDNTFSSFNTKTVFFELIVESENDRNGDSDAFHDILEGLSPEEFYDVKVQDILDSIVKVRGQLTSARQIQDILKSYEARDRNIAEENFFKVNTWSFFQICAMLTVGALQVIMVRSIFDSDSRMHHVWKKLRL